VAEHKGIISRPAVLRGIRKPEFQATLPSVKGAYFDLFGPRDLRRTIVILADTSVRASKLNVSATDHLVLVTNRLKQDADTWLVIPRAFQQMGSAAVRVTHPQEALLDTAVRVSGSRGWFADTSQQLDQSFNRSADTGQILFNVIINEQHEIQP
jgi:hypothetical protein